MSYNEIRWNAADETPIFAREWAPETPAAAVVVLIHGLGEHSNRYAQVAADLNAAGFAVVAPDLHGHGLSGGKRGHFPSYDAVMEDIARAFDQASQRFPGLPQFLYGHSLGGNLVLYYTLTRKPKIKGVISSSPGLEPGAPVSAFTMAMAKIMYTLAPSFTLKNGLQLEFLSHDPAVLEKAMKDPNYHPYISARLGLDMLKNGRWIEEQTGTFPIPLLLMQGTGENLVNPAATKRFAAGISGDVTYREWEGWYHELHNEVGREEVLATIITWLRAHLA